MGTIQQFSLYDEKTGELISRTVKKKIRKIEGDWIVFFTKPLTKLIESTNESAIIRVYLWLASKQTFNDYVLVDRKTIYESLRISRMSCYKALKWLMKNNYVSEVKQDGIKGFFINPNVTTKGSKNFKEKKSKWSFEILKNQVKDHIGEDSELVIEVDDDEEITGI